MRTIKAIGQKIAFAVGAVIYLGCCLLKGKPPQDL